MLDVLALTVMLWGPAFVNIADRSPGGKKNKKEKIDE